MPNSTAAELARAVQNQAHIEAAPGEWAIHHNPAVNVKATISKAAGSAGVCHVLRSLFVTANADAASAPTAVNLVVNVRDGATGAGTVLWSDNIMLPATAGARAGFAISGLNIIGTAATAMTVEFTAAGGANTFESVNASGYSVV